MTITMAVIGGLNMDLSVRVARLPAPGETVSGEDASRDAGGKGGNQAVAAARLGADVRMIGKLGDDAFGQELRSRLVAEGVDAATVGTAAGTPTGLALIVVQADGENTITLSPGANHRLDASEVGIGDAEIVLIQLEVPIAAALAAAHAAKARGALSVLNAAPRPAADDALRELLRMVDVLVVNETEAAGLLGAAAGTVAPAAHVDNARTLLTTGPGIVVVTLGAAGAVAVQGADTWREPGFRVEPIDAVGAGDAFCAELAVALGAQAPIPDALRRACAAGALATTRLGAQAALPSRAEVDALIGGDVGPGVSILDPR
jgi:ribokinase